MTIRKEGLWIYDDKDDKYDYGLYYSWLWKEGSRYSTKMGNILWVTSCKFIMWINLIHIEKLTFTQMIFKKYT